MPLHSDDPKSVGGYRLVDRLGTGGMGVVYRARTRSGRDVAVKVVHAQYAEDAVFRTRFRQEIEAVRRVSGAFTASVVDADAEAVRPWMATQYVPGASLAQRIRDRGPLRDGELRRLALGLVEALREIHRAGVVHRDLKPANVLIAGDGPRVIDFGISRAAENHTLTETGQMIGTPPFMSPEQLTDARTVGPASDVFSLGSLLVYTLTGKGPFDADSPYLTAYRVIHDAPVLDEVPPPLRAILEQCLAKDAADRPGLDELAEAFAAVLPEGDPEEPATVTPATDVHAVTRPGRRLRRRPVLAAAGTVGALVLALTAYLLAPGFAESGEAKTPGPSPTPRWVAPPSGWKPWQTTVYETAASGARKPLEADNGMSGSDPECVVEGHAVYCGGDGILPVRVDGRSGRTVWRADTAPAGTERGSYYSSVLGVRDGIVLVHQSVSSGAPVQDPSYLLALDAGTGERLWTREVTNPELPLPLVLAGDLVLAPEVGGRRATARAPRSGAARWTAEFPAGHNCERTTTTDTRLYAYCVPNTREARAAIGHALLVAVDTTDGSARRLKVPLDATLLEEYDGRVALALERAPDTSVDSGFTSFVLVDPDSGARTTVKLPELYEGRPAMADGKVLFTESSGRVTAVSPRTGKRLWRVRTSLEKPGTPVHDRRAGTVYLVSSSGRIAALDESRGTLLWETLPRTAPALIGSPRQRALLYGGALVVAISDGTLCSLDPAHPERKPVSG
ncbi:protein kinase domain-containing protein [Streptomyces sp. MA5143a]|uniref:serine/threonine-protein kinase n=1 Tax=Streptomyces sp. MA5143a TaxID=2083010 RepID=UPI000D1B612F|nr:serine/threonine-protein kinase [Streptomyces sp. MA5143a]SPF00993.1 Serine/threonine-protein kinase AfsK [Streptomyces sp. MA5143a]